jgi:hypothetical protein
VSLAHLPANPSSERHTPNPRLCACVLCRDKQNQLRQQLAALVSLTNMPATPRSPSQLGNPLYSERDTPRKPSTDDDFLGRAPSKSLPCSAPGTCVNVSSKG